MKMTKDFISGFASAIGNLGSEGDDRGVDWSAPHEYLKTRLATFVPVGDDIVERLRHRADMGHEAADEIERLRTYNDNARESYGAKVAELVEAQSEIERLRAIVTAPLKSDELRLVDKHCDWIAFQHAWNAVMKGRREEIAVEQSAPPEGDNDQNGNRDLAREIDGA